MRVISEGPTKITKSTIEAAWRRRTPKNRLIVRDKDCRGLALIVNPTGMTWSYAFRPRGTNSLTGRRWPNRTVTLGNPATHSPEDARVEANRFKGQVAAGVDPPAEKKKRAETERRKQGTTLGRLADDYAVALPRRPKIRGAGNPSPAYVAEEVSQLALALAMMGVEKMPVRNLTADDVRRLLGEASSITPPRVDVGNVGGTPSCYVPGGLARSLIPNLSRCCRLFAFPSHEFPHFQQSRLGGVRQHRVGNCTASPAPPAGCLSYPTTIGTTLVVVLLPIIAAASSLPHRSMARTCSGHRLAL